MSLINQMLQDLESRRATLAGDAGMPHEIRSLPPQRASLPWVKLLGVVALVLLAGAVIWWFSAEGRMTFAPPPGPAPVATAPAAPAVSQGAPSVIAPAPAPVPALPPAPPPLAAAPVQQAPEAAVGVDKAPAPQAPPPPPARTESVRQPLPPARKESTSPPKASEDKRAGLKVATALGQVPTSSGSATTDETRIEKKVRMSSPRERAENEYRRALGLVNQGRLQEGITVLRSALSEDAGHVGSRLALFGLLIDLQRHDEAQALLQDVLARDPAQPQLASRLARLQLERGDAKGAEETLSRAAAAADNIAEFRGFHAAVLQRLTLHKEAVTEYQAALRLMPQAGIWWMGLGISLEAVGKPSEAREAYQRAKATGALTVELTAFVEQKLRQLQ